MTSNTRASLTVLASLLVAGCVSTSSSVRPNRRWSPDRGRLELGPTWSCVFPATTDPAFAAGPLGCWGEHPGGDKWWAEIQHKLDRPARTGLKDVSVGPDLVCALDQGGWLSCWWWDPSHAHQGVDSWPGLPVLREVETFAAIDPFVCAASSSGSVMCAVSRGGEWRRVPGVASPVDSIFLVPTGSGAGCAVMGSDVACWGPDRWSEDRGWLGRARRARPVDSDPWSAYACAMTSLCIPEQRAAVDALATLRGVELGPSHGCGLDAEGRVSCVWYEGGAGLPEGSTERGAMLLGRDGETIERGHAYEVEGLRASAVAVASDHACALTLDSKVRCWGSDAHCQTRVPEIFREGGRGDPCTSVEVTDLRSGARTLVQWGEFERRFGLDERWAWAELLSKGEVLSHDSTKTQFRCIPGPPPVPHGCRRP